MAKKNSPTITFRDVSFAPWKTNFSGEARKYNEAGDRNFDIIIEDEELAEMLRKEKWNVKKSERDDGDYFYYLPVAVSYDHYPPEIYILDSKTGRKTLLDEQTVGSLDYARIERVNLEVSGNLWNVNGKSGCKAYVSYMNVFIKRNPFEDDFDISEQSEEEIPF